MNPRHTPEGARASTGTRLLTAVLASIVTLTLAGCSGAEGRADSSDDDPAAIYATVIRRLIEDGSGAGGTDGPTYVLRAAHYLGGSPPSESSGPVPIPPTVQQGITEALASRTAEIIWIDPGGSPPSEPDHGGGPGGGGAIVTSGPIDFKTAQRAVVHAQIYLSEMNATTMKYVLDKNDGVWSVSEAIPSGIS